MRLNRFLCALLLACCASLAHAYTYVGGAQVSSASAPGSITLGYTPQSGDLLVLFVVYFHHSAETVTPTDTQGNTWNEVISSDNTASYGGMRVYYAMAKNATANTITVTFGGLVTFPAAAVVEYSGLIPSPYVTGEFAFADRSVTSANYSAANSNSSGLTTTLSGNPDLAVAVTYDTAGSSSSALWNAGTGFTGRQTIEFEGSTSNVVGLFEDELVSSNSPLAGTFTATTSASTVAPVTAVIVFHQTSSGCTHAGYSSSGAISTPNGTSGAYLGKAGAFVTPDCASIQYFQPTVGNFATN